MEVSRGMSGHSKYAKQWPIANTLKLKAIGYTLEVQKNAAVASAFGHLTLAAQLPIYMYIVGSWPWVLVDIGNI